MQGGTPVIQTLNVPAVLASCDVAECKLQACCGSEAKQELSALTQGWHQVQGGLLTPWRR